MSDDFESWVDQQFGEIAYGLKLTLPGPNQSLFKYVSLDNKTSMNYLEQTLSDFKLIGKTAKGLNDPFELFPAVFDDIRPKAIEAIIGRDVKSRQETLFGDLDLEYYRYRAFTFFEEIRNISRVIAFSDRYDSPLLWAHYANSYRGACLHFLGGKMRVTQNANFGKVIYADQRPLYPLSLALALSYPIRRSNVHRILRAENNKLVSFTKARDWAYEQEYRIVYNANQVTNVPFNPESLASIIVGPSMEDKDLVQLLTVVTKSGSPQIPIRRAKTSSASFAVTVEWQTFSTAEQILQGADF